MKKILVNLTVYFLIIVSAFRVNAEDNKIFETLIGNSDAKIVVKEYLSLTCSHCSNFHIKTFPKFKKKLIDTGLIKLELIDYPLDRLAMIATAIVKSLPKDSHFDAINILLKNQKKWAYSKNPVKELLKFAKMFGVTEDKFNKIISNRKLMQNIIDKMESENSKFDIQSTPTFIINNKHKITGYLSYEEFEEKLNEFGLIN